ncbi:MAG TPA: hypothetical protein VF897_25495 [Roseiflexaceae bacterium]
MWGRAQPAPTPPPLVLSAPVVGSIRLPPSKVLSLSRAPPAGVAVGVAVGPPLCVAVGVA